MFETNIDKKVDNHREKDTSCDYEAELAEDAVNEPFMSELDQNAPKFINELDLLLRGLF